jgi:hypothetical protein
VSSSSLEKENEIKNQETTVVEEEWNGSDIVFRKQVLKNKKNKKQNTKNIKQ